MVKVVLVDVIKAFESQVNATENVHGLLRCAGCVPIPPLNTSLHLSRLQPDMQIEIENGEVV